MSYRQEALIYQLDFDFSPILPFQSFSKIAPRSAFGHFDNMLRVNKLDETQSVLHRIFIYRGAQWRIATLR